MASITLKNVPAELHLELKKRAEEYHRSLNREIIATLKSATGRTIRIDPAKLEELSAGPGLCFSARSLHERSIGGNAKVDCNTWAQM
jgi:plasmid stability protein